MTSSHSQPPDLDGHWDLVRAEFDGDEAPQMMVSKTELLLTAGTYEVVFGGEVSDRGTFEAPNNHETKTVILHGEVGPNAGRTIPAIYQRRGDRLRVCYGLDGVAPTEFATAAGQQRYLATYRLKPPAP